MLRRSIILLMALLYISITAGVAVNFHFCMDQLASVSFGHEKDHADGSCTKCGMSKTENHCCKDESFFVKLSDTHQPSSFANELTSFSTVLPVGYINLNIVEQGAAVFPVIGYSSPPPLPFNKVYLANNVFII